MQKLLTRLIYLTVAVQLMVSCSVLETLQTGAPASDKAALQNQRATSAALALQGLEEIDTLIRLDNDWLEDQVMAILNSQAATTGQYSFRKLKLSFVRQTISLDATIDISDNPGNVMRVCREGLVDP